MRLQHRCTVAASPEWLWDFMTDMPKVGSCIPWLSNLRQADEKTYHGTISVKIGPVSLTMDGKLAFQELRPQERRGSLRGEAADRRGGGKVAVRMEIWVQSKDGRSAELLVDTEVIFFGKLGEFGQPIVRRKADSMMEEFIKNLARQVAQGQALPN